MADTNTEQVRIFHSGNRLSIFCARTPSIRLTFSHAIFLRFLFRFFFVVHSHYGRAFSINNLASRMRMHRLLRDRINAVATVVIT